MRYRVLDLPVKGVGAFTPLPPTNPTASSWGLVHVTGAPGTVPVAAPAPERSWLPSDHGNLSKWQPSNVAPDVILPDQYVPFADNMGPSQHFGMALRRKNPLPVPALSWISAAKKAMIVPRIGGRAVANNPRAFQRYPNFA